MIPESIFKFKNFIWVQNEFKSELYLLYNALIYIFTSKSPPVGLEPTTVRLTVECSTSWAKKA